MSLSSKITSVLPGSQAPKEEVVVDKGEEVGFFEFGGSSIVVAFEPGRIQFDEDLKEASRDLIEMDVEMGMQMGRATAPNL